MLTYNEVVIKSYNKSKFKDNISEDSYKLLALVYIKFIFLVMNNKLLKRVRFPGLCLFYPSTKNIQRGIDRLSTMEGKEQRILELNNILNSLNKNGKNKQKKIE